jgi:flagellar motor switch protein FliG
MANDSTEKTNKEQAAFLKTEKRDKGYTKAAQLLIILGKEQAAKVLKHLSEEEALAVSREIAQIQSVSNDDAKKVLNDFGYLAKVKDLVARGGLDKAKEMLEAAFGTEKGDTFYRKIIEKTVPHPFAFLNDLQPDHIIALVREESAPVISLILSHIDPLIGAKVLTALPIEIKKQVVQRIASMDKITPEVIRKTEEILKEKIKTEGEVVASQIDGKSRLVEILKNLDASQGKKIMDELSIKNPELASELESKLFSLDIVFRISDKEVQTILRDIADLELAKLIKGKDEKFIDKIIRNVSTRRAEMIRMENKTIGKILKTELEHVENDFLFFIKQKVEKKEITILDDNDEYI